MLCIKVSNLQMPMFLPIGHSLPLWSFKSCEEGVGAHGQKQPDFGVHQHECPLSSQLAMGIFRENLDAEWAGGRLKKGSKGALCAIPMHRNG